MGGEQLAIFGDSLKIIYLGDLFSYRGSWGLESWSIWPQISHLIRGRTQVPYLPVQPPFHHPRLLTYSNTVQVCYILTIRPWIVTLQACSGVASDSRNPHLYWNIRASWNLFLDLTSTYKGWHALLCILWMQFLSFNIEPTCHLRARVTQIFYDNNWI